MSEEVKWGKRKEGWRKFVFGIPSADPEYANELEIQPGKHEARKVACQGANGASDGDRSFETSTPMLLFLVLNMQKVVYMRVRAT